MLPSNKNNSSPMIPTSNTTNPSPMKRTGSSEIEADSVKKARYSNYSFISFPPTSLSDDPGETGSHSFPSPEFETFTQCYPSPDSDEDHTHGGMIHGLNQVTSPGWSPSPPGFNYSFYRSPTTTTTFTTTSENEFSDNSIVSPAVENFSERPRRNYSRSRSRSHVNLNSTSTSEKVPQPPSTVHREREKEEKRKKRRTERRAYLEFGNNFQYPPPFTPPFVWGNRRVFAEDMFMRGLNPTGRGMNRTMSRGGLFDLQYIQRDFGADDYELLLALDENKPNTRGAAKQQIDSLTIHTLTDGVTLKNEQCSICLENIQKEDQYKILPCQHSYHPTCIDTWLGLCNTCPVCAKPAIYDNDKNSGDNDIYEEKSEKRHRDYEPKISK